MALNNWMADLNDGTPITRIAIPGTHDSGAFEKCRLPSTQAHAAERNIRNQLDIGVRALDIRCGQNTGVFSGGDQEYYIYHGGIGFNTTIKSVVTTVTEFLADNKSEFVILILKQETGSVDISVAINGIINDANIYRQDRHKSWPTLGVLRKKVLILNRLNSNRTGGLKDQGHYDVGGWSGNPEELEIQIPNSHLKVLLQDLWKFPTSSKKYSAIKKLLEKSVFNKNDTLYLNFMSYSWVGFNPDIFGQDTNQWLINSGVRGNGVICVDAVDEAITDYIIKMNHES